jgi:hypothetical protein
MPSSLLFSVNDARKLLIFLAWGARGPGFKSRQPDQIPQTLTVEDPAELAFLESIWSPKRTPGTLLRRSFGRAFSQTGKTGHNPPGLSTPIKTRHIEKRLYRQRAKPGVTCASNCATKIQSVGAHRHEESQLLRILIVPRIPGFPRQGSRSTGRLSLASTPTVESMSAE